MVGGGRAVLAGAALLLLTIVHSGTVHSTTIVASRLVVAIANSY